METNILSNVAVQPRKLTGTELDKIAAGFLKITLTDVLVSSYSIGGSHGDETPIKK